MTHREKICSTCGRPFAWRRKWRNNWDEIRYCGAMCRRRRPGRLDREIERVILELAARCGPGSSVRPSEVARRLAPEDWRRLIEPTRRAARRLARGGRLDILQRGRPVDPGRFRGPIRLRLRR